VIAPPDPKEVVRALGGAELAERLDALDRRRDSRRPAEVPSTGAPDAGATPDFDVVMAGGGLSLMLAPLLADRGLSVAVLDRGTVGAVHREWNASRGELATLHESGLFTASEVDGLVVNRYRHGVCRWHGGGSYPVTDVLDNAVDAEGLLHGVRARAEARGVAILDRQTVLGEAAGDGGVRLEIEGGADLTARLMVDARGAASPYATADLICPTVGGVVRGSALDPTVGDVLATIEHRVDGRQHLWEGFPGRPDEVTVYLFYYADAADVPDGGLTALYAKFFEQLGDYAGADAALLRPTFGYIPGWSRLRTPPSGPHPRIRLFGDAAARHSPLTFCGFGAMLRAIIPAADAIAGALDQRASEGPAIDGLDLFPEEPIHRFTGALARIMARPGGGPEALNGLLDAAFGSLHEMGDAAYGALLKDQMSPADFTRFLRTTARKRPGVYRESLRGLGLVGTMRWGARVAGALTDAA
jgi:lycopene cyclase CruA